MYKSEINQLLNGTMAQQSYIINLCSDDPAVHFYFYLDRSECSIDAIQELLYTNSGYLTPDEIYFLISQGDLTDAEMTAIADAIGVDVSAIWSYK
jgi:hypothetical protein